MLERVAREVLVALDIALSEWPESVPPDADVLYSIQDTEYRVTYNPDDGEPDCIEFRGIDNKVLTMVRNRWHMMKFTYVDNLHEQYDGQTFDACWGEYDGDEWVQRDGGETLLILDLPDMPGLQPQHNWKGFGYLEVGDEQEGS